MIREDLITVTFMIVHFLFLTNRWHATLLSSMWIVNSFLEQQISKP